MEFEILSVNQNTPEWLDLRRNHIGASDAPIILGESPFKSPIQLWEEKLGIRSQTFQSASMKRGHDLEPLARHSFQRSTGISVEPLVIKSKKYPWMIASLDGISQDFQHIVEIKCPGKTDHQTAVDGFIPKKYQAQLQHQMICAGVEKAYYYSFDGVDGVLVEAFLDDSYVFDLLKKEKEFFDSVESYMPPQYSDDGVRYIQRASEEWISLSNELKKESEERKIVEEIYKLRKEKEDSIKKKLIELANQEDSEGNGIRLTKIVKKGRIDYEKIPELQAIDLEQFRKPNEVTFRFSLVE